MFREIFLCETGMHSGNLACLFSVRAYRSDDDDGLCRQVRASSRYDPREVHVRGGAKLEEADDQQGCFNSQPSKAATSGTFRILHRRETLP